MAPFLKITKKKEIKKKEKRKKSHGPRIKNNIHLYINVWYMSNFDGHAYQRLVVIKTFFSNRSQIVSFCF